MQKGLSRTRLAGPALLLASRYSVSIIGPLVSLLVVRYLGPETYGLYASATAVTTLFAIITDFGLQQAALELAATQRYRLTHVVRAVVSLGALYSLIAYAAVAAWMVAGGYDRSVVRLALYSALGYFQIPLLSAVTVALQVSGRYSRIALWNWASSTVKWVGTLAALVLRASVEKLVLLPVVLGWAATTAMVAYEGKEQGLWQHHCKDPVPLRQLFRRALQFGSAGAMHQLYHHTDAAFLSLLKDPVEVGQYTVAFRVIELLNSFPGIVFNQVLYPKYFKWFKTDPTKVRHYYPMMSKWMLAIGGTAAVAVSLWAREILLLLFGSQQEMGSRFLAIMAWAVPLRFVAASAGAVLATGDCIGRKLRVQAVVAVLNISLNLALIPDFGGLASAVLMVFTDGMLLSLYAITARKALALQLWETTRESWLALAMVVGCLVIGRSFANATTAIRLGMVATSAMGALAYLSHTITPHDRQEMKRLMQSRDPGK